MPKPVTRPIHRPPGSHFRGFTLIEVMIAVAIVAILAAIAVPAYSDYIRRGKIIEATTALSDFRTRMEQYFLDNRTYVGGCVAVGPGVTPPKTFTLACPDPGTATTYSLTATGIAAQGMGGFVYTINQANAKATTGVASGWTTNATCWVTRKNGSCS